MKNKTTFFLLFIVSEASFISKKIKEQGFLRKSHQKTYPLDPGSRIRKKFIPDPDPGSRGKKHRIPDPQHWPRVKMSKIRALNPS
jgi:hypothetical protein